MAEQKSLIEMKAYSRRGDIYRWLREHYEKVLRDTVELQRPWAVIALEIGNDGVQATRGKNTLCAESVRQTWKRVCRDVQAAREREIAERIEREVQAEAVEVARRDALRAANLRPQLRPRIVGAAGGGSGGGRPGTALVAANGKTRLTDEEEERILAERTPDGKRTQAAVDLMMELARRRMREENLKRN